MHACMQVFTVRLVCSVDGAVRIMGVMASTGRKYERVTGTVLGWEEGRELSTVQS